VNVLAVALIAMLAITLHLAPAVQAASSAGGGSIIHWNSNMIYAGQNNGLPWGPVGENAGVSGANFPPNQQLRLVLVAGNINNNHALCKSARATVGSVTTDGSGAFQHDFTWPAAAGQVNSEYSICGLSAADGNIVSHQDDGPFTVLSASPPTLSVSPNSVSPQGTVTFSGQNWVPPQTVTISVNNNAFNTIATNSSGLNSGTFSVTFTFPSSVQSGSYTFTGNTANGLLVSGTTTATITALPTPTATVTTTATVTGTPTATDTTTPTAATNTTSTNSSNNTGNTSSGNAGQILLVGLIVAVVLILLAGAGLVIYMIMQRSSSQKTAPDSPPGTYGQPMPPGGPYADFGSPMQSSSSFNAYDQATQQGVTYPGSGPLMQPTGPMDNYVQPMQQGGAPPGSMPANSFHSTGTIASVCMNCGMPLAPSDMRCNQCGMPVGAQNPNTSNWGR
jgi:hypothetical protein